MALPAGPFCVRSSDTRPRAGSSSGRAVWPTLESPSLPVEDSSSNNNAPSSSATPYWCLPPGLSLQVAGARGLASFRDDYVGGSASRSNSTSSSGSHSFGSSSVTSNSSLFGGPGSSDDTLSAAAHAKRKLWLEAGEDPQLAAARKALWEDSPTEAPSTSVPEAKEEKGDEAGVRREKEEDWADDDLDPIDLPPVPSPSRPSHSTLTPLASCLRPPLIRKKRSTSSLGSSSRDSLSVASVRISVEPPEHAVTYSAIDYERRGEGPVEKLSIKEWVELKGVKEAVGVWSGKIDKWVEQVDNPSGSTLSSSRTSASSTPTSPVSTTSELGRSSSCGSLAALVGVVSVGSGVHHGTGRTRAPKMSL